MNESIKKGIFFALLTATISGFSIFYNKLVISKGIDASIFNIIKNGGVAFILSLLLLFSKRRKSVVTFSLKQWGWLVIIGIIGGGFPFILYFEGLKSVSAVNATLIHKSMFIWVTLLAIPLLGERLNIWQIIGFAAIAWSNLFIGGFNGFKANLGEIMILASTIFWSMEFIVAKRALGGIDSQIVAWGRMTLGLVILSGAVIFQNKLPLLFSLPANQLLPILGSIILLTGYVLTWYKALQLAPATVVTSILIIATPITNLLSAAFITHNLSTIQLTNLIFTTFGIILILFFVHGHRRSYPL